jgi:hypothetical protein
MEIGLGVSGVIQGKWTPAIRSNKMLTTCADPEFACTRADRRILPVASRPGLPSNGVAMLLPFPVRYPTRIFHSHRSRNRRYIGTFRGAEAGTRAGGGFANGGGGRPLGRGYESCRTLVRSSRERAAERREALPEKDRPAPKSAGRRAV